MQKIARESEANVYSQSGEDGILADIFRCIGDGNRYACEFGAWDGKYCSNVASLIDSGWTAVMIEGDPVKFTELQANYHENEQIVLLCAYVDIDGSNSLDAILQRVGRQVDLDLLSVDIDGNDYWILAGIEAKPRVICVEFNVTMGPWHGYINPRGHCHGTGMASFVELMTTRGYYLVYATVNNLFFVRGDQLKALQPVSAGEAFQGFAAHMTVIGSFFDGGNVVLGAKRNMWTQVTNARAVMPPAFLRRWPQSRWRILTQQLIFNGPMELARRILRRLGWSR